VSAPNSPRSNEYDQADAQNLQIQADLSSHSDWMSDLMGDFSRQEEIERLHEEFPDLDSDALEDLHEARMQDDCDEFGGYCSGGS